MAKQFRVWVPGGQLAMYAEHYHNKEERARAALAHLQIARELFKAAGAVKTVARVRLAISSAKGAVRHASHEPARQERQHNMRTRPMVYAERQP